MIVKKMKKEYSKFAMPVDSIAKIYKLLFHTGNEWFNWSTIDSQVLDNFFQKSLQSLKPSNDYSLQGMNNKWFNWNAIDFVSFSQVLETIVRSTQIRHDISISLRNHATVSQAVLILSD